MKTRLQEQWANLPGRQRTIAAAGGLLVAASLLFVLVVDPILERRDLLDRQIARQLRAIGELAVVGPEYVTARARLAQIEKRIEDGKGKFSLLPYLEEAAAAVRVRDRIVSMQPNPVSSAQGYKETAVELRLESLQFPELLALLVKLEDSPYVVQVKRLQVKPRFDAGHLLEVTLQVSTYEKN
jgi:general secretion pathway protein M